MKKIIFLLLSLFLTTQLLSDECDNQLFSISLERNDIKLSSIIERFARECKLSLIYENKKSKDLIENTTTGFLNLKDLSIEELVEYILTKYDFHYTLENNTLSISKIKTKTFRVDYIDSKRDGTSNTDVSITGATSATESDSGAGSTGAKIETTETFNFWEKLQTEISQIIHRPEDGTIISSNSTDTNSTSNSNGEHQLIINSKGGFVTVSGTYKQLQRVENYLDLLLDSLKKQVLVDVKVISVILDDSHSTGINWSKFELSLGSDTPIFSSTYNASYDSTRSQSTQKTRTGTLVFPATFSMDGFMNFLKSHGDTRSMSNPKVLTMNNQPTLISVGDNINYLVKSSTSNDTTTSQSTEPKELFVGVLLDITPQIDDSGFISLRINPSISEFKYAEDAQKQLVARELPPDTVTRRISSVVRVEDSSVVVLGGLISSNKSVNKTKVPILGDIPYIGNLFRSSTVTDVTKEIVFVLTPKIVSKDALPSLADLDFKMSQKYNEFPENESPKPHIGKNYKEVYGMPSLQSVNK